jgi:hypothetical protein
MSKLENYVRGGGHAIVTSGFVKLMLGKGIENLTSIRYRDRHLTPTHYQYHSRDSWEEYKVSAAKPILFPLMEHRNNSSWMTLKGQTEEKNLPILIRDCYGKGQMITFVVPDNFTDLQYLPKEVLNAIRREFCDTLPVHVESGKNVGLFLYDNDTMIVYPYEYLNEGPQPCFIHVKGDAKKLVSLSARWKKEYEPIAEIPENKMLHTQKETVFKIETFPDVFDFIKIER